MPRNDDAGHVAAWAFLVLVIVVAGGALYLAAETITGMASKLHEAFR